MNLDNVTLELQTTEYVRIPLAAFPLIATEGERVKAARRLIRHAGKEIGAKVKTVHMMRIDAVIGLVDRDYPPDEMHELMEGAWSRLDFEKPSQPE